MSPKRDELGHLRSILRRAIDALDVVAAERTSARLGEPLPFEDEQGLIQEYERLTSENGRLLRDNARLRMQLAVVRAFIDEAGTLDEVPARLARMLAVATCRVVRLDEKTYRVVEDGNTLGTVAATLYNVKTKQGDLFRATVRSGDAPQQQILGDFDTLTEAAAEIALHHFMSRCT